MKNAVFLLIAGCHQRVKKKKRVNFFKSDAFKKFHSLVHRFASCFLIKSGKSLEF